ncbi:serine hydrolase domain-containing protein [Lactiplantibacillus fabifermentans]|uniref:Serine-type D-Ala-D-Ala carboxypeptidase n=1 Tax=Lactiplantibacillus fabifermentans DSM 21115 TaxID=1413187 RepID=A0A0R2NSC6_9LACO|nr:serine hydrolase domain-containing protein [Lactiplantibacillus fabifermentans]KRO27643.1 serine-type D-Ala-D-Ala carboxypeptidase [Lactiplantibacillus fabifermentans DSM 21115]
MRWRWWQAWLLVGSSGWWLWAAVTPTRETSALPMYVAFKSATVTTTALPATTPQRVTVRPAAVYIGTRAAVVDRQRYQHRYGWVSAADFKYQAVSVPTITAKNWLHVDHLVATQHIQGTLLVAQAGQATPTIRSYGLADRATHTLNGATTVYPIASLQKAMTGVMIGQLVASGQLQLDQPIAQFYPHLKNARHITIQQLLNHTSGLYMPEVAPKKPLTEAAAVQWVLAHVTVQSQHQWRYCSANYTLLAGIIRQVTGQSYAENLTTRVLKPAGMTTTKAWTQFHNLPVATPYFATNRFFVQTAQISLPLLSSELGAGDIGTTVTDYYRFVTAFNDGTLLPIATRNLLTSTRTNDYAAGLYYGLDGKQHATGYDNDISNFYSRSANGQVTVVFFMNQANHYRAKTVVQKITEILAKNQ